MDSSSSGLGHGAYQTGGAAYSSQSSSSVQKRNRTQLSCTSCRHGKLKCDRQQPCSQCARKGRASQCTFPTAESRKPVISLKARLKHLESLVKDAMTAQNLAPPETPYSPDIANGNGFSSSGDPKRSLNINHDGEQTNDQRTPTSGQVLLSNGQTYVGATHWAAILEDIEEVKGFFDESSEGSGPEHNSHYSSLLWNVSTSGKADMLANLPPRLAIDRLISRYFNSTSPALCKVFNEAQSSPANEFPVIIHRPTFNKHYRQFWLDPGGTPTIFIGLLYAIMTLATLSGLSSGEVHPDTRGTPHEMLRAYKENCVQCLVLSDYTKPTRYTLETMMIYGEAEFLMSQDDQVHCYLMISVAVRLALRMGLHRDSSKIGTHFTPFEAESRRRLWYHINQLDLLFSFHIGLPGMTQTIESDTLPPRNLLDEDFDEHCTELPPSRPESEMTPISYALCKGRLSDEAGKIMILANKLQLPPYEEVLKLDASLREAYAKVPPQFRLDESEINVTDSSSTILKRFTVSVLFEKSLCMLHRKFLMKAGEHPKYQYSKQAGLDAAMKLLYRQGLIHQAASPGGPLPLDRWFLSSFSTPNFLLAAMIVYVNVMNDIKTSHITNSTEIQAGVDALEMSRNNWEAILSLSPEAKKAYLVLVGMVDRAYQALGRRPPPKVSPIKDNPTTRYQSFSQEQQDSSFSRATENTTPTFPLPMSHDLDLDIPEDPFESMLNLPNDFDWELFDTQIRPQMHTVPDVWADFNTDFENGMNDDYDL